MRPGESTTATARPERARIAASEEAKRQNLVRKELAWLRRSAPARSQGPMPQRSQSFYASCVAASATH